MNNQEQISVVEDLEPEVLETVHIQCPKCHAEITANSNEKNSIVCFCCERKIRVKDRAGELDPDVIHETLLLPKGSVRASIALLLSVTCWMLVISNRPVPPYLFSLLVAVISYYFAFRKKESEERKTYTVKKDEFEDVTSSGKPKPLYLPAGFIRYFLISGFVVCAALGWKNGFFEDYAFREFFFIFAGLVAGYFFAKFANCFKKDIAFYNAVTHIKGLIVISAAMMTFIMLVSNWNYPIPLIICSSVITFYFGSKS